jgi:hypothetical protein
MSSKALKYKQQKSELEKFIAIEAIPAFKKIRKILQNKGKAVILNISKKYVVMTVKDKGNEIFGFKIIPRVSFESIYPLGVAVYPKKYGTKDEEIIAIRHISAKEMVRKILNCYKYCHKLLSKDLTSSH